MSSDNWNPVSIDLINGDILYFFPFDTTTGSSTSTSDNFLKVVDPSYAVICVGKDNSYNHPKKSVMDRLKKYGIKVYRTDEQGTITVISDGENISFDKTPASYSYMK